MDNLDRSASRLRGGLAHIERQPAAFTLIEVMVAMTIFLLAVVVMLSVYLASGKRVVHSETVLKGVTEIREATDFISQSVRSAPLSPAIQAGGLQLLVAPRDLGYATVLETTWIDVLHNVKGSKSNQRMLHVSNVTPVAVAFSVFASAARPPGVMGAGDVATYLADGSGLPATDLNDLFAGGDTITIPATSYGSATTGVINSISNNPGNKTLTLTANLGVNVPNGTRIAPTRGPRALYSVEANGDLRYYPDNRDLTKFTTLAHDLDSAPLTDPTDNASPRTVPFSLAGRYLTLNLQKLPRGTVAGRTVQGVLTNVLTRTDPLIP